MKLNHILPTCQETVSRDLQIFLISNPPHGENQMKNILAPLVAAVVVLSAGAALADGDCTLSSAQIDRLDAVRQMAVDYEWKIEKIEMDDGCYELDVTDRGGNRLEAEVDPVSMQVMKAKIETFAAP